MNGHELTMRAAIELGRHAKRFPRPNDPNPRFRCRCGQWIGDYSEWPRHVTGAVLAAAGDDLFGELAATIEKTPAETPAQEARRYGYKAAADRAKALLSGCTCRAGLILGSMGCQVEGHDTSDGDLE